jgi:hypothetical protein
MRTSLLTKAVAMSALLTFAPQVGSTQVPLGPEFRVSSFIVAWDDHTDFHTPDVFARRFHASGAPAAGELRVNTYTTGIQSHPAVATDGHGNVVVTWSSDGQDGSASGVFGQRFGPDRIFGDGFDSGGATRP